VARAGETCGQFGAQEVKTLADCNAAIQQERTYLIDNAGALTDQPLTRPVQGLQVELIDGLCGNESHRRALHRHGDCFASRKSFFCPFE
jgi:hypothetical protein